MNRLIVARSARAVWVVLLCAAAAINGCRRQEGFSIGDVHPPTAGRAPRTAGPATPVVAQKKVSSKQEPATLIAFDGSRCVVNAPKFRETAIGESVWCAWKD